MDYVVCAASHSLTQDQGHPGGGASRKLWGTFQCPCLDVSCDSTNLGLIQ